MTRAISEDQAETPAPTAAAATPPRYCRCRRRLCRLGGDSSLMSWAWAGPRPHHAALLLRDCLRRHYRHHQPTPSPTLRW